VPNLDIARLRYIRDLFSIGAGGLIIGGELVRVLLMHAEK